MSEVNENVTVNGAGTQNEEPAAKSNYNGPLVKTTKKYLSVS